MESDNKIIDTTKSNFRVNRRDLFLTYPKAKNINLKEDLYEYLKEYFSRYELRYLIVARELH